MIHRLPPRQLIPNILGTRLINALKIIRLVKLFYIWGKTKNIEKLFFSDINLFFLITDLSLPTIYQ
jgi:hypothetical protein